MTFVRSFRDPIHGFIHADRLESELINSAPLQRLRSIHQLAFTHMVYPGAEHTRFPHVLGAMALAGRVYDVLAARSDGLLDPDPRALPRRLVRIAALVHDIGHAPFSHSAEELFEEGIDHEEMSRRLLAIDEMAAIFDEHGDGVTAEAVARLLGRPEGPAERLLSQVVSGELDVDKMDYLMRDSLHCGVRYGHFDLDRLLETMLPIRDPQRGSWGIGVEEGGVHALEALVMARYYMFTQVYFNVTGKALELHFSEWLRETGRRWPADPLRFLEHDDVSVLSEMRRSDSLHARAVVERRRFPLAYETHEHLTPAEKAEFEALLPRLLAQFGPERLLVSNSAKDPHRLAEGPVLVRSAGGRLQPMEEASQFIRHLERIERYRIYSPPEIRERVAAAVETGLTA
ncbi:MAG: HD domain-containing protein [Thermoanaerobaculia bacterium]|nr:HD domain-containing protein [Thermoanaerobaculia bacterium]